MPTIFRQDGFRFFFYSNEGNPREPVHVHVMKEGCEAKFWLDPVALDRNHGFDAKTLRQIGRVIHFNQSRIAKAWHDHFSA